MENTNNTSNQKLPSLKVFLEGEIAFNSLVFEESFVITDQVTKADLVLEQSSSTLEISITYLFNGLLKKIKTDSNNLKNCMNLVYHTLSRQYLIKEPSNLNSKSNSKVLNTHYKSHFTPALFNSSFENKDLHHFLQNLFQNQIFESYKTIHLFTHEKGSGSTNQITIDRDSINSNDWPVQTFTTLFNAVKKSKNRSFGQSSLKASNFQVIGTCLAHESILETHNIVFIITKNDFIPQSTQEINNFKSITTTLKFFINQYLIEYSRNLKIKQYEELTAQIVKKPNNIYQALEIDKLLRASFENLLELKSKKTNFHSEKLSLLGELLNTLRHELSNPLFGLQLSSELLKAESLDPDQLEMVEEITTAINRSQSIIENFSELYKTNSLTETIDIANLINEVFTLTKSESRSIKQRIEVESLQETNKMLILGNKTWLAQVFFNLIINSAQAMKDANIASPEISIKIRKDKTNVTEIHFMDNGPGINESENKIFSPFFTTKKEGTGLGLNICKNLMEKMNGNISLIKNDKGAYFKLILPNENSHS